MSNMTNRQRITANAALSMIALHGHNPGPVQQAAKQAIARGVPGNKAYSEALESFAQTNPGIRETLGTVIALITNSDAATLSQYDDAIGHFNNTGDNSKLDALGPMIVEDYKALLVRNGQATAEELADAEWDAAEALGFDQSAVAAEPWQPAPEQLAPASPSDPLPLQESNDMTPLTSKEYSAAVRELRARTKGPIEDSPEYAHLQARMGAAPAKHGILNPAAPTGLPKAEMRNSEPYIPAYRTATGAYVGARTGEAARRAAGVPITDHPE